LRNDYRLCQLGLYRVAGILAAGDIYSNTLNPLQTNDSKITNVDMYRR